MKKTLLISALSLCVAAAAGAYSLTSELPHHTVRNMKMPKVTPPGTNIINPELGTSRQAAPPAKDGFALYEDFEAWNGDFEAWLPEGWKVDHKDSPASNRGWKMTQPLGPGDFITSKCLTYELFEEEVDEWVVTPEVTVSPGMELSWSTMTSPYFYDWSYFDDKTFTITEFVTVNNLTVNVSEDGGETWTTIYDHAEELVKETGGNFFAMFNYTVRPFKASLADYEGKNVTIGFRISGTDGNTTFLDDVSVGLPPTKTKYTRPQSGLFFGLSDRDLNVPASIMVGPAYTPVKYTNATTTKNADFTWTYTDSDGEDNISNETDLSVTYRPDYTDAFTTRNNLYPFPVLEGKSEATSADSFTYPGFFQAGGRGEYEIHYTDTDEREVLQLGLTVIDPITEGAATYADIAVPYFGYNQESDRFWGNYTFHSTDMLDDENYNHLEKYGNLFYTPEQPIVIDGVRANAYGKISRNTVFTADIYLLNAGFTIPDEPAYTAICTGEDIGIIDYYSSSDFISLNFKFDEPVVINKRRTPYFFVAIGGFRDPENVQYFSPEMSDLPNPNNLGLGWGGHRLCWNGEEFPFSWSSVTNVLGDKNKVAFYIMLDAELPWLYADSHEIEILPDQTASLTLDSYYDGSRLTFTGLPEWLSAKAEGRYDKTVVTFTAAYDATARPANITIDGPGVSVPVKVSMDISAVDTIVTDGADEGESLYTLDGRKVAGNPSPGIYIVVKGGKATKRIVK